MKHRGRSTTVVLAVFLAITPARRVFAQSSEATATELFDAGRDLMKAGDYAGACPKLAASLRLDAKVGTLARLAECEEHEGQLANAHAHWARALSLAQSAHDPRLDRIKSELARVNRLVARLDVELAGPAPAGVALRIDGVDMGSASFGLELPVERGDHAVEVSADGMKTWSSRVAASEGGVVVKVSVPPLEAAPAPPPSPPVVAVVPVVASEGAAPSRPYRMVGLVVAGVGVVGVGSGVLIGVLGAKKDLNLSNTEGCRGTVCTTAIGQSERASAVAAGNIATGVFIGGAVLAAVGVTLVLLPPKASTNTTAAGGAFRLHLGLGSVALGGSF